MKTVCFKDIPWNKFKSENVWTTSWVHWKDHWRLTIRKHAFFNPFHFASLSILPGTHEKTRVLLMFSGSIEREQGHEMFNKSDLIFSYLFFKKQLESFLQNKIVDFRHLILTSSLSPITLIKLFLFFLQDEKFLEMSGYLEILYRPLLLQGFFL